MQKKKGKQLIGLLVCLAIGGAALGFGISDGVFKSAGSVFGNIQIDKASILTLIVMIFGVLAVEKL